mmetsp:Transcript_28757/g.66312  ORF Transcript_28757/g.66312 Transcript_28757/m.66312 type:complete len:519 (-) Transcript_28757:87-1643(-)
MRGFRLTLLLVCNAASLAHGLAIAGHAQLLAETSMRAAARSASRYQLNLKNFSVIRAQRGEHASTASPILPSFDAISTFVGHREVVCVNCDSDQFNAWVQEQVDPHCAGLAKNFQASDAKHPNAPGYNRWANSKVNLLGRAATADAGCNKPHIEAIEGWDKIEALRLRLPGLWAERQLIVGLGGPDPLNQQMDFVEALSTLARRSPLLVPKNCGEANVPRCNAHITGSESTATGSELRLALRHAFGDAFLRRHTLDKSWNETQQRASVQALLSALKSKYSFYYQRCLSNRPDLETCNTQATSELVGRIACGKEAGGLEACVYSELRLCGECATHEGNTSRFFEYARYHGPLQLFHTSSDRNGVMGQCEEFSRAGYALLAALGYEARYVLDFTDHVWVEVRLPHGPHGQWVHADPSEGVLDSPFMYEDGWGKQLTMIFAFTPSSIEHITARYTRNYTATEERRGISEDDLALVISEVNSRLQHELPIQPFGFAAQPDAGVASLQEAALWSHFEADAHHL